MDNIINDKLFTLWFNNSDIYVPINIYYKINNEYNRYCFNNISADNIYDYKILFKFYKNSNLFISIYN